MNAFVVATVMGLMSPQLESSFHGMILDTNGDQIHLKVKVASYVFLGKVYSKIEADCETLGLLQQWIPSGLISSPIGNGSSSYSAGLPLIRMEGFYTVKRGDTVIFQMYAPAYWFRFPNE